MTKRPSGGVNLSTAITHEGFHRSRRIKPCKSKRPNWNDLFIGHHLWRLPNGLCTFAWNLRPSYLHRTHLHVENGVSGRCQGTVNFSCFRSEPDGQNHPPRPATTARVPKSLSKGNQKASGPNLRPHYDAQQNTTIFKMWRVSLKLYYVFTEPHFFSPVHTAKLNSQFPLQLVGVICLCFHQWSESSWWVSHTSSWFFFLPLIPSLAHASPECMLLDTLNAGYLNPQETSKSRVPLLILTVPAPGRGKPFNKWWLKTRKLSNHSWKMGRI